jgi:catechol 2,3-dioxygenase-like lactoylglutathione lyase family enzyme
VIKEKLSFSAYRRGRERLGNTRLSRRSDLWVAAVEGSCCFSLISAYWGFAISVRREGFTLKTAPVVESISAVTLATRDMAAAVRFYRALGFEMRYGGEDATFTSFRAGPSYLNLIAASSDQRWSWWGRVIFYVSDVDALYAQAIAHGLHAETCPRDAEWGERYFHLTDPDGHELSFAKPLQAAVDRNRPTAK